MRRSLAVIADLAAVIITLSMLSACGGGGSNTNKIASVTIAPSPASVNVGNVFQFAATPLNSSGTTVSGKTTTFTSDNPAFVTVTNTGLACAGTWDSLTTPVVCTPSTAKDPTLPANQQLPGVGKANVTATIDGVTSAPAVVSVHRAVDNVTISPAEPPCVSQTKTQQFTAQAFSQGLDVTSTVGTFNWTPAPAATIATIDTNGLVTAVGPGRTPIFASIGSVQSTPAFFTTCPVAQIKVHVTNSTATTATLDKGTSATLVADVIDSADQAMSNVALKWNTSQPVAATVSSGTVTTVSAGTATITASCSSPNCNINLPNSIYSNAFVTSVNGSTATTVWVASTQGTSLVPIDTTTNTPGTPITLGDKPNSMLVARQGDRLFLGSATGLIVVTLSTNTAAAPLTTATGKVIAVSPDETTVLLYDTANSVVRAVNVSAATPTVQTLNIPGAVAASFAPDSSKAYIVGNGKWTVWSSSITPLPTTVTNDPTKGPNGVDFLASGAFGYIAGADPGVGARATCDDSVAPAGSSAAFPTQIAALPDGSGLLAVASPNIELITATSDNKGCPPALQNAVSQTALNGGSFSARQLIVTPNGSKAFVTSNQPGTLLGYNVTSGQSTPIQLGGGVTETFTAGVTLDSAQLYVGAGGTNNVHRVDLASGLDAQQIPVNVGGTNLVPDLLVVQPK